MRIGAACVIVVAIGVAATNLNSSPASAQADRTAAKFWQAVQATCDATAAEPPSELGRRIAKTAIDEFTLFGGHQIDADGRLFRYGLTEAQHTRKAGADGAARLRHVGWWQVMKYWRALYGEGSADKLEVRGYRGAADAGSATQAAALLRTDAAKLLRATEAVTDPVEREVLREAILRAAAIDTPWSAAFVSYVLRQSGATADGFRFANAHRVFIYDAFATSAAELTHKAGARLYRACPITTTRPRVGDLICQQREPALADASAAAVRERIRADLDAGTVSHSIRQTHCEVVAHVDAPARKIYSIGGNVNDSVSVRKLNLRQDFRFSPVQDGRCGGPGHWTLPQSSGEGPQAASLAEKCSLNDKNWFVLLQLR